MQQILGHIVHGLLRKEYTKCLEERCLKINELELHDTHYGFRHDCNPTDQILIFQQIFEKNFPRGGWNHAPHS